MNEPLNDPPHADAAAPVPQDREPGVSVSSPTGSPTGSGWFSRLSSVLFIVFCFELGLFLLIYPWTESWSDNYFAWAVSGSVQTSWHGFWNNSYVRGGVSGLGVVNVWIAILEVFRLFARKRQARS
jgi:hypothetical protein